MSIAKYTGKVKVNICLICHILVFLPHTPHPWYDWGGGGGTIYQALWSIITGQPTNITTTPLTFIITL